MFFFVFYYYFSFFTRFLFSGGQFDLVSPVFVYFSAYTLLSPTLFISTNSFFDMSGDAIGVRIGYSRTELVSFRTPEQRIDRKTRKNLFHHQLWCPRFRRIDKRYDLRRNHRFCGPGTFFVSARRSTFGDVSPLQLLMNNPVFITIVIYKSRIGWSNQFHLDATVEILNINE